MRELPLPTVPLADLAGPATSRRSLHRRDPPTVGRAIEAPRLDVVWARDEDEVLQAQRLRHLAFAEEMGARLSVPPGSPAGHDIDLFDPFCEHLLVRAPGRGSEAGPVIGTYRVLTPANARRVGGLHSDKEFDLTRLRPRMARARPVVRSPGLAQRRRDPRAVGCAGRVHDRNALDTMIGCASVSMRDGGHVAASLWAQLRRTHLAPIHWQVTPRLALPVDELRNDLPVEAPALIKGYLRCGAKVLGAPAWDPDFNTADLPMLLRIEDLPARYRRHFLN